MRAHIAAQAASGHATLAGLLCLLLLTPLPCSAEELRVAVATNFAATMRELASDFSRTTGHELVVSAGATGKLYAQIVNGAPFDLFFAADEARPQQLEAEGRALADAGFVYAVGTLVLWSPQLNFVDATVLSSAEFRYLAIANPRLAPYGAAAQDTLEALELWTSVRARLVRGENIGQTLQFVRSGNAELGFIARSQHQALRPAGSFWPVPPDLHRPLRQRAAVLTDSPASREFAAFLQSPLARERISSYGYDLPNH